MIMLALAAALVLQTALPENPSVDYSGLPQVSGHVTFVSHAVTLELYKDYALVSSVSQIHNDGGAGSVTVTIPRGRIGDEKSGSPGFGVSATWVNTPIQLGAGSSTSAPNGKQSIFTSSLKGTAKMTAGGSYALRINYRVPLGRCGFDKKQYLAAYDLASPVSVGVVNVTYKYAKGVVFRLPLPKPDLGWQMGDRGAFVRLANYDGQTSLSYMAFYSGGFGNIGG